MDQEISYRGTEISVDVQRLYVDRSRVTLTCLNRGCPARCTLDLTVHGTPSYVSVDELADVLFSHCGVLDELAQVISARGGLINLTSTAKEV